MNEKNVNRFSTILIIIGIILFVVSCAKTAQTLKVYTALQQKVLEESKETAKQTEEIVRIYAAALDRNTAVYEKLIQLLEDLTQD